MSLVSRAKNLIISPRSEWAIIAGEPTNTGALYTGYIIPLVAIGPIAGIIGHLITLGGLALTAAIIGAIVQFVLGLVGVFIMGWIAAILGGMFGGHNDFGRGLALMAYGSTASWVGGIFHIYPLLGLLSLVASIYSLYILYCGISPEMNIPAGKSIGYLVVLIIVAIIVFFIISLIVGLVVGGAMVGAASM